MSVEIIRGTEYPQQHRAQHEQAYRQAAERGLAVERIGGIGYVEGSRIDRWIFLNSLDRDSGRNARLAACHTGQSH